MGVRDAWRIRGPNRKNSGKEKQEGKGRVGAAGGTQTCNQPKEPRAAQAHSKKPAAKKGLAGGEEVLPVGEAPGRFHQ